MKKTHEIQTANKDQLNAIITLLADDKLGTTRENTNRKKPYEKAFREIQQDPTPLFFIKN